MSWRSSLDRPAKGSSRRSTLGSCASAMAISMRRPLAVGGFGQEAVPEVAEADAGQGGLGPLGEGVLAIERHEGVPTQGRQAEQRQSDVAQDRVGREQRDDLVGAGEAEVGARARLGSRVMSRPISEIVPLVGRRSPVI